MSKCANVSNEWLYFFGILAAYAMVGLFFIVPGLISSLAGNLLLIIVVVILVIFIVLFAIAIILKGLSRLFYHWKR